LTRHYSTLMLAARNEAVFYSCVALACNLRQYRDV
jgi:hypothetical protein